MRSLAGVPCWLFDALHVRFGGAVSQQVDLLRQIGGMPSLLEKRCGAPNWLWRRGLPLSRRSRQAASQFERWIRPRAAFSLSALWASFSRSPAASSGSMISSTPSRPTTLGRDSVTPYLGL